MGVHSDLRALIDAAITTNGTGAITGSAHNGILNLVVDAIEGGYLYAGMATAATNPSDPEGKLFYLATTAGTYTNFSGIVVAENTIVALKGSGTTWTADVVLDGVETASGSLDKIRAESESMAYCQSVIDNHRDTILDDGGTYYPNNAASFLSVLNTNSLLTKANNILIPSAVKTSVLYSIKGDNFDVSRSGDGATIINSNGYIENVTAEIARINYEEI